LTHKECPLAIYVPTDNTIYHSEIINAATGENDISGQKPWKPVLILLSVRLVKTFTIGKKKDSY
jgi:hypothetical protein